MPPVKSYRRTPSKRHQVKRVSPQTLSTRRVMTCMIVMGLGTLSLWIYLYASVLTAHLSQAFENGMGRLGFRLEDVVVEGRIRTDKNQILTILGLARGNPLLSIDLPAARAKLEEISWIKSARVERRLPHTLYIRILEKEPISLWQNQGKTYLVDRDGECVQTKEPHKYKGLLIITGAHAPRHIGELMSLLEKFPSLRSRVTGATHLRTTRWDIRIGDKIDVKLPDGGIEESENALSTLLNLAEHHHLMKQDIMTIDMRLPGKLILRLMPDVIQQKNDTGKNA